MIYKLSHLCKYITSISYTIEKLKNLFIVVYIKIINK